MISDYGSYVEVSKMLLFDVIIRLLASARFNYRVAIGALVSRCDSINQLNHLSVNPRVIYYWNIGLRLVVALIRNESVCCKLSLEDTIIKFD